MTIYFFIKVALALGLFAGLLKFLQTAHSMLMLWWQVSTVPIWARTRLIVRAAMVSAIGTVVSVTAFGLRVCVIFLVFVYLCEQV